jgi:tripartite-type tricarboxylate transporter receptor subunit TctC
MRLFQSTAIALLLALGAAAPAAAQGSTVRIIVPSPAGGLSDGIARALSAQLRELTGDTYVVENRAGASTTIGMRECGLAKPDGRTFCITLADSLSYNPHVFAKLPYDAEKFIGVAHLGAGNALILVNPSFGFSTYKDLLSAAKQRPGGVFWATFGDASLPDVIRRWTNLKAGVEIAGVPYKGLAPAQQGLIAGEVQAGLVGIGASKAFVASGALKPVAVVGKSRAALYPSVPTLNELGLDMGLPSYFGLYAPRGTPPAVVARTHALVQKALESEAMKQFSQNYTLDRIEMTQPQFDQFIRTDRKRAAEVFKALGIRPGVIPD